MLIKKDYSYINTNEHKLIDNGYAELSVHSIHFDRFFTEEQKAENKRKAERMAKEDWNTYCDNVSKSLAETMGQIIDTLVGKYNIHQVSPETSTIAHYKEDWDLYFYSNRGWNGKDHMDYFQLSFNDNRRANENLQLLDEVLSIVEDMSFDNVYCRIQYDAIVDEAKVEEKAASLCESLAGQFINYLGLVGRIKPIWEREGVKLYGFFKKGARSKYYNICKADLVANYL